MKMNNGAKAAAPSTNVNIPPIWKESLWPVDWVTLRLSAVYYGIGVPRGDGSPVILVPGFMGTDAYLYEMYLWLGRMGYRAYMSGIGLNAECPARLTERLERTMVRTYLETGKPVSIVGHSLGGIIGRRACLERPELVSRLIYMGTPVQAVHAHPAVVATAVAVHTAMGMITECMTDHCTREFAQDVKRPLADDIHHASIYTRADGVVDWHDAQEIDAGRNHEVGGTHIGLVYNPKAYRVLANLLAYSGEAKAA